MKIVNTQTLPLNNHLSLSEAGNHVGVVLQARSGAKGVEDGKAYAQQVQTSSCRYLPDTKLFTIHQLCGNNDARGLEGGFLKQAPKSSESVATQAVALKHQLLNRRQQL